jgi:hypothetical protein
MPGQPCGGTRFRTPCRWAIATLLLASAAGCGPGQGRVSGRVLLDGKPVPGGFVMFVPADLHGQSLTAQLDESGKYTVQLPTGEMLISVDNRQFAPPPPRVATPIPKGIPASVLAKMGRTNAPPPPPPPAETGVRSTRYVKIPERYYQADTADLKFTVLGGEQQHDIELTSK